MTKEQYEKISAPFRNGKNKKWLLTINKGLTGLGYATYPAMLVYLFFSSFDKLPAAVMVPGAGFILLTLVRRLINRPRPYEALDIEPIIKKDTKGNSMPSRHVFSMTEIAMTGFIISPVLGGLLLLCSICLSFIRVIGGVHYPADVTAGVVSAMAWCTIFYTILL